MIQGNVCADYAEELSANRWAEDLFIALPAVLEILEHIFGLWFPPLCFLEHRGGGPSNQSGGDRKVDNRSDDRRVGDRRGGGDRSSSSSRPSMSSK